MKLATIIISGTLFLGSCSSDSKVVHLRTVKGKSESKVTVVPNRMLTMEIEGMTCEMGCGGSIRKELKASGGVSRVQFDFEEGRKVQTAKISFDTNKITADEMIKIVSTINEKQFTVGKTNSESITAPVSSTEEKTEPQAKEEVKISSTQTSFAIPNLFEILSVVI